MCLTLITWEMRALWLHTGKPRALQNQCCSLPCGLAGPSVVWCVGSMGFVCLVHCLAAGYGPHHQQPVLDHRTLHCECADLPLPPPACRVPSTPREREGVMWAQRLKWPCVPHKPPDFSAVAARPTHPYTQSIPLGVGHTHYALIHSLTVIYQGPAVR